MSILKEDKKDGFWGVKIIHYSQKMKQAKKMEEIQLSNTHICCICGLDIIFVAWKIKCDLKIRYFEIPFNKRGMPKDLFS